MSADVESEHETTRAARARASAERLARRMQEERPRHRSLDAVLEMAERDGDVGGGIIAGALAYRMFIWLLPVALIAVAGLGFAADASSRSPEDAAERLGLGGLVSNSIASAANSPNRWYALLIGIPVLVWATRSLLRVLIGAHRLVWTDAAGPPEACALVRDLMGRQVFRHRLVSGSPDDVAVAAKTGTLPGLHMEAGVARYPDGECYAIAVFARTHDLTASRATVDAAIGRAAGIAAASLRGDGR